MSISDSRSLDDLRTAIDSLDERIVALIAERQRHVVRAGELKRDQGSDAVRAPGRVDEVVSRVQAHAEAVGASPEVVGATYRAMIDAFIALELSVQEDSS